MTADPMRALDITVARRTELDLLTPAQAWPTHDDVEPPDRGLRLPRALRAIAAAGGLDITCGAPGESLRSVLGRVSLLEHDREAIAAALPGRHARGRCHGC